MNYAQLIHEFCIEQNKTLSLAESCTGGALAAAFTKLPDCSKYFKGGVIAYSNEVKENILGCKRETLEVYGAVDIETVKEMALGAIKCMKSDFSIAVSGIAGSSGGSALKPVGTICAAIADRFGNVYVWTFSLEGSREKIINETVNKLLKVFWQEKCR